MTKLKAFTVIELAIALLLSSFVISITYAGYRIIMKQYLSYQSNSSKVNEIVVLDRFLNQDMMNSRSIFRVGSGISCINENVKIDYIFSERSVLRYSSRIDTFKVNTIHLQTFFQGDEEFIPGNIIDRISFDATYQDEMISLDADKKYASDVLMQYEKP